MGIATDTNLIDLRVLNWVKLEKPNDITTFTFQWYANDDEMQVVRHVGNIFGSDGTVETQNKTKARVFWNELISVGYKPC